MALREVSEKKINIFVWFHEKNSRSQYPYHSLFQFLPNQSLSEQVKFDDWLKYIIFPLLQCTKQTIDILPRYFIIFLASLANVHYKYVLTWASGVSQSITCFNVMYHHTPSLYHFIHLIVTHFIFSKKDDIMVYLMSQ